MVFTEKWSPVVNPKNFNQRNKIKPSNPKYLFFALLIFPFVMIGLPKLYTMIQFRRRERLEKASKEKEEERQ
jgi:hypothetical protein